MDKSLLSALLGGLSQTADNARSPAASGPSLQGSAATRKMAAIAQRSNGNMVVINANDLDNITIRNYGAPQPTGAPDAKKTDLVSRQIDAAQRATFERLHAGFDKGSALVIQAPQGGENDMVEAATFAGFEPLLASLMFERQEEAQSRTVFMFCANAAEEAAARARGLQMSGQVETKPKAKSDVGIAFVAAWRDEETGEICMMASPVNVMKGLKREVEEALPNRTQISWSPRPQMSLLQAHEMQGSRRLNEVPTHAADDLVEAFPVLGKAGNFALKNDADQPDFDGLEAVRRMLRNEKRKLVRSPDEERFLAPGAVTP